MQLESLVNDLLKDVNDLLILPLASFVIVPLDCEELNHSSDHYSCYVMHYGYNHYAIVLGAESV